MPVFFPAGLCLNAISDGKEISEERFLWPESPGKFPYQGDSPVLHWNFRCYVNFKDNSDEGAIVWLRIFVIPDIKLQISLIKSYFCWTFNMSTKRSLPSFIFPNPVNDVTILCNQESFPWWLPQNKYAGQREKCNRAPVLGVG